jgi:hypothetical protein
MPKKYLVLIIIFSSLLTAAQIPVRDEPRHHNVFENSYVRLLDVFLAHVIPPNFTFIILLLSLQLSPKRHRLAIDKRDNLQEIFQQPADHGMIAFPNHGSTGYGMKTPPGST